MELRADSDLSSVPKLSGVGEVDHTRVSLCAPSPWIAPSGNGVPTDARPHALWVASPSPRDETVKKRRTTA